MVLGSSRKHGSNRPAVRLLLGFESIILLALALTAAAVYFREPLTRENVTFTKSDAGEKFYGFFYDDASTGGASKVVEDGPLDWTCELPANRAYSYCGFGLLIDKENKGLGIDLSDFDSIEVDLTYSGKAEYLRLTLKDHDPRYSKPGQPANDKVNQLGIPAKGANRATRVNLADFGVPEWWKEQSGLPPELTRPEFKNIVGIEFVTGTEAAAGEHRLQLRRVTFERTLIGTEAWYGGIATCWMALVGLLVLHRRRQSDKLERRLADRTLNSVPEVIWSVGPAGRLDFVSQQWARHYGGAPEALVGRGWLSIIHPDDRRRAMERWFEAQQELRPFECEYRILLPDGSHRWALVRARPDLDDRGGITRWYGTCSDAHERVLAVEALKASERLYRGILEASIDCVAVLSPDGVVELVNGPGVAATELGTAEAIEGKQFTNLWQRKSEAMVNAEMAKARSGEVARFQCFCPTAKGKPKWWDVVLTPMHDEDGEVRGILAISRDISADREKSEQLRWASEHDALTSLPNRRAFQTRLQTATLRAMKTGERIGLLIVDLDHFKHINDSLGHVAGDVVLQSVAERLRGALGRNDFVARVGGDEFAIILEDVHSKADIMALGQKMFNELQTPFRLRGRAFSAGASLGGALFPEDAQCANDLFKMADTALYALKGSGRGGTMLFHRQMLEEVEKAAAQLGVARHAVSEKTVVPVYQPKVEVQSGKIVGFEALLRWRHPSNGLQPPATVEEAFKDYELAAKIGELMQNGVAGHIRSWMTKGLEFGRVSINASPAEFLRDDYAERLLAVLKEHSVPPAAIEIEVTEHALLDQGPEYVARALALLKAAGVHVSLDDFGTGYSSLSHLRDFPVDLVKVDKSFVQQMTEDPEIASIVSAVVNLARSIEIDVVAEGVETPAQLKLLRSMGCSFAQGHLFGRPIEQAQVVELLDESRAAA